MIDENRDNANQENRLRTKGSGLRKGKGTKKNENSPIDLQNIYDIINSEKIGEISRIVSIDRITRNKVRNLIGRWFPPYAGGMTIKQVVGDIFFRITNSVEGRVDYRTGNPTPPRKRGEYLYVLIVKREKILFVDENKKICYVIGRKEK